MLTNQLEITWTSKQANVSYIPHWDDDSGENGMRFFCTVEAMIAICSRFIVSNRKKSHNPIGVFGVENAPVLFFSQIYTEYL